MNNITFEQFMNKPDYKYFMEENPNIGLLKVQVFAADQAIPLPNTRIFITKEIEDDNVLFFEGITDSSGIIDNIKLPAPSPLHEEYEPPKSTIYRLIASNDDLKEIKQYRISMYGDIKVLQYIKMVPNGGF